LFQDYQSFFEAVESEELFEYLRIEIPKDEVEYIIKNAPKEEVNLAFVQCIK
jgi:hypothetical protein